MAIMVFAPEETRQVLVALEDWKPGDGISFTLERREGAELTFSVAGLDDKAACDMALHRIQSALGAVKFLRITPKP